MKNISRIILFIWMLCLSNIVLYANLSNTFTIEDDKKTMLYGVHEITIEDTEHKYFTITKPDNGTFHIHGFITGENTVKARIYCNASGTWRWANENGTDKGSFIVGSAEDSKLKGKLKVDNLNIRTDNGDLFLPILDTGYSLFNTRFSPFGTTFKDYINEAEKHGATMIRVGAVGMQFPDENSNDESGQHKLDMLYSNESHTTYNYANFNEDDKRIQWALKAHPNMQFQLILLGGPNASDNKETQLKDLDNENKLKPLLQYMVDRYSAYPNISFLAINDLNEENENLAVKFLTYIKDRDPFNTLRSSGFRRIGKPGDTEKNAGLFNWDKFKNGLMTYIHLETDSDLGAKQLDLYRYTKKALVPIISGEDVYESHRWNDLKKTGYSEDDYNNYPYIYRRGMWSWILSGGGFNYCGAWRATIPYNKLIKLYSTGSDTKQGGKNSINDFHTKKYNGMKSLPYIRKFFTDNHLLKKSWNFTKNGYASNTRSNADKSRAHSMVSADGTYVIYTPINSTITINSNIDTSSYKFIWYNPSDGKYDNELDSTNGANTFEMPSGWKDGVLLLTKTKIPVCTSRPTLSYQTSGTIDPAHTFKWNKDISCVDDVSLYIHDMTTNKKVASYKGSAWNYTVNNMNYGHNIKVTLKGYDKLGRQTGDSRYYYFTIKNTSVCTSRPTLSYQTSGTIDPAHTFKWNKDTSCVDDVSLYIHDMTTNKKVASYKGSAWNYTVNNMNYGHNIKVTLKGYDKLGRQTGDSRYYYFTIKKLPIVTQKAYLISPKNGSSNSHTTALNGTTTFSVKRYANEVIRFRIYDANSKKYLYKSGLTSSTHFAYNFAKNGHRIYIYIYSYDATRNNKYIGVNAYYNFKTATTPPKPPKITNYNAYLVYQTKGNITSSHKFAWNKKSFVKYVSLYIWDKTSNKEIKYYKGTAWNQTIKNLPKGHQLEIILKSYDKHNKKLGSSNYYYFTVK